MKRQAFLLLCSISFALGCDIPDDGGDDDYGDCEESDDGTTDPSETGTDTSDSGTTDPTGDSGTEESCDTGADTSTTGDSGDDNACGFVEPNEANDSVPPQDPDDPEIITACTALCEAQTAGIEGCATEAAACLESCKMRSCEVCPSTLAPLVDCETAMFTGEGCSCEVDGIDCPVPAGCSELEQETGFCGG